MTDLRARNNMASKKSYNKTLEKQFAFAYEDEVILQHSRNPGTTAWHWSVVPEDALLEAGYIHDFNKTRLARIKNKKESQGLEYRIRDYGFDGLARHADGNYHSLQAKYYLSRDVTANDIGTFLAMQYSLICKNNQSKGYLYTAGKLQKDLEEQIAIPEYPIRHVLFPWKHPDGRIIVTKPLMPEINETTLPLRDYQRDALNQLIKHTGINALNIPCRMGKTLIAGHILKHLYSRRRRQSTLVVVIAPLRISVENLQDRLAPFLPNIKSLLVDSDGTTNEDEITQFIGQTGYRIIYSTFKSAVDVLSHVITDYADSYILADEIHNASKELCEFINQFPNGLVMSATIPEEITDILNINHTVYIPFSKGISDGYIVDYTLWLPHLTRASDGTTSVDIEIPQVDFLEYNKELMAKAMYNAVCMLKTGSRRCIAYLPSKEDCKTYIEYVKEIFEKYHGLSIWTGIIDSDVQAKKRKDILTEFQNGANDVYHILASVRILDEAVDIPKCDSVFITLVGERSSDIRMLQRSQRSSTLDPTNPAKHNNIFLWADGWEKCVQSLELLKEGDPEFHKKIRIVDCNYDKSGVKERIDEVKMKTAEISKWAEIKCLSIFEKHMLIIKGLAVFHLLYGEPKRNGTRDNGNEKKYATWIFERRKTKKKGILDNRLEDEIHILLPWLSLDTRIVFSPETIIQKIKIFHPVHGEPKRNGTRDNGNEHIFGLWINNRRQDKRKNKLDIDLENEICKELPWLLRDSHIYRSKELIIEDLIAFILEHEEMPIQKGNRPNESYLASNISKWRLDKKNNKLDSNLEKQIIENIPLFSWDVFTDSHIKRIKEIKTFYEVNDKPKRNSTNDDEKKFYNWISHRCRDKKNNKLDSALEEKIRKELPWLKLS